MHQYIASFTDHLQVELKLELHGELLSDLADAKDKLEHRIILGYSEMTRPVIKDGLVVDTKDHARMLFPGVSERAEFELYRLHKVDEGDHDEGAVTWSNQLAGVVRLVNFGDGEDPDGFEDAEAVFVE